MALVMLLPGPGGLHQAQHRIEPVAAGVVDEGIALGMGELDAQTQARLAVFERGDQVLAGNQAVCLARSSLL